MTFPSGPHDPWGQQQPPQPYGPPQQYGGPQQYPGPPQFGAPQYGGQQYGAPQYGQPPYGYGMPPQHTGGSRKGLIIGGAVAAVVAVAAIIGVVIVLMMPSGDERAIGQLLKNIGNSGSSISAMKKYVCAGDRKILDALDTSGLEKYGINVPTPTIKPPSGSAKISDIKVNGDRATAKVEAGGQTNTIYFRKESGDWKLCTTDSPGLANLPSLP
ncbi:hypothetical protein [Mycobacterium sp. 852013-50091_SCH5140682]|uniref:Rv0361 family membrane protein n=1 Tax=Mycobacterium sp. 852013-50091_SCH5140682 TaxID=1834109 RepID=UPI000A695DDE|nr:hypothetical protein [Mycobacterium sp. 852013-50091_SCH5140682]